MGSNRPLTYYIITLISLILGLGASIILSYTYFEGSNRASSLFCSDSGLFNCSSVISGEYSLFLGLPISMLGVWLYFIAGVYLVLPLMTSDKKNYLYGLFFWIMILANIINIVLLWISIFEKKSLCTFCIIHYISTLLLTFAILFYDFKEKKVIKGTIDYLKYFWNSEVYQKEVVTFVVISVLLFSSIFLYSQNRELKGKLGSSVTKTALNKTNDNKLASLYNSKVFNFDAKNAPFIGNKEAPGQFLIFHDYQCSYCLNSYYQFKAISKRYPKLFKIQYINYPFFSSSGKSKINSNEIAQYSLVAHKFGKYFEFTELIYKLIISKVQIDLKQIEEIFKKLNITKPFSEIQKLAKQTSNEITRQKAFAKKLGIKGTPTILFNNRLIPSGHNYQVITKLIDATKLASRTGKQIKDVIQDIDEPNTIKAFYNREVFNFDAKEAPFIGNKNAPAKFLVFHDYQCGFCLRSYYDFKDLVKRYPKLVKVQYINSPFFPGAPRSKKSHFDSNKLAQYSLAAHKFGKYFEFTDLLYGSIKNNIYIDLNRIKEIFKKLNIKLPISEIDKVANESSKELERQWAFAKEVDVRGTPTILFNGRVTGLGHNHQIINKLIDLVKANRQK